MKSSKQKIICVGFQKTGTTSLKWALEILGYRVGGNKSRLLLPILQNRWNKILEVLDRYDAVEDNPWALIYRKIDQLVPGCKFILTYRDPESWYGSVQRYFRLPRARPPMHEWIYGRGLGQVAAEKENAIRIYRKHIEGVREYFRDRPGDFMEIDISKGEGWRPLCEFLGCEIPDTPFPHARDSKKQRKKRSRLHRGFRKSRKYLHYGVLLAYIDWKGFDDFRREPGTLPGVDRDQ